MEVRDRFGKATEQGTAKPQQEDNVKKEIKNNNNNNVRWGNSKGRENSIKKLCFIFLMFIKSWVNVLAFR